MVAKKKGWFKIPGVQDGDRPLEAQVKALRPAIGVAKGRTVLDLGCAEGLIGLEFVKGGAKSVHGIDSIRGNIETAQKVCAGQPMTFEVADLNLLIKEQFAKGWVTQYDIVLALGITHKLHDPADGVNFAARSAKELVLFRSGEGAVGGIVTNKWNKKAFCDAHGLMKAHGWRLNLTTEGPGPWRETVEYWRRADAY